MGFIIDSVKTDAYRVLLTKVVCVTTESNCCRMASNSLSELNYNWFTRWQCWIRAYAQHSTSLTRTESTLRRTATKQAIILQITRTHRTCQSDSNHLYGNLFCLLFLPQWSHFDGRTGRCVAIERYECTWFVLGVAAFCSRAWRIVIITVQYKLMVH